MPLNSFQQHLAAGQQALNAGDWQAARDHYQAAVDVCPSAEALEGLALAAWWLDDTPVVFECHERAYRLYRQQDDQLSAARVATWLGMDHYLFRAELAIADGWLRRAQRLLAGSAPSFEQCWLALMEAHIRLFEYDDVSTARRVGAETFATAEALGLIDLQVLALALEGLALVSQGEIAEGMRRLDESTAAALSGDVSDPDAIVTACCYLIYACDRVRDYERALQWCEKVEEVSRRWDYRSMFAVCRTHYAGVLLWRGDWAGAERELTSATRELMTTRVAWAGEPLYRLAELRRRQGRLEDAAALIAQAPAFPLALLCQAELALERHETTVAADLVERYLRRVPPDNVIERVLGLEVAVRVYLASDAFARAQTTCDELTMLVEFIGTPPFHGSVSLTRGLVAASTHQLETARRCFEDAVDAFHSQGAPYETARARCELARVLALLDRQAVARVEAEAALVAFEQLGAERDIARVAALLKKLQVADVATSGSPANLTRRELEVLGLIACGFSNPQIAERLFISVRTVERHISAIYEKLGAAGTAARAIATAYALEHGLAARHLR